MQHNWTFHNLQSKRIFRLINPSAFCCKEQQSARWYGSTWEGQLVRRWRKCTNPLLLSFRHPLPLALTQKLSWFVVWCVQVLMLKYSFAPDRYLFLAHLYDIQRTPPHPTLSCIYFALFLPQFVHMIVPFTRQKQWWLQDADLSL